MVKTNKKSKKLTLLDLATATKPRWHIYQIVDEFKRMGLPTCNRETIREHLQRKHPPNNVYKELWCKLFNKKPEDIQWL